MTTGKETGHEGAEREKPGVPEAKKGNGIREISLAVQVFPNIPALFEWSNLNILQVVESGRFCPPEDFWQSLETAGCHDRGRSVNTGI